MKDVILKWLRVRSERVLNSIAFYPVIIAFLFLIVAILMISLDFSETGKEIKSSIDWVQLKDATTARSIISAITAGIISLTVFSFSMVMIVLNQAASQLSNRVLDNLIGNRFQQIILGIYIGTIVYALFLLSTIRDIDSGIYIPALSIYMLILLTIIDIFLFIYFLHYITRSVKYETIIHRIFEQTISSMKDTCRLEKEPVVNKSLEKGEKIFSPNTGIFQGFDRSALLELTVKEDFVVAFNYTQGTFVLEDAAYATTSKKLMPETLDKLQLLVNVHRGDEIDSTYYYGIRQLVEVAVKALSPGINDPGTAIESLRALLGLLIYRVKHYPDNTITDETGKTRIIISEKSFEQVFNSSILPIWDYGKGDRLLREELLSVLEQLVTLGKFPFVEKLLQEVRTQNLVMK